MELLFYFLTCACWEFAPGIKNSAATHSQIKKAQNNEFVYLFCSDLIYDFLMTLGERLTEVDASTILTVLDCKFYYNTLAWSNDSY